MACRKEGAVATVGIWSGLLAGRHRGGCRPVAGGQGCFRGLHLHGLGLELIQSLDREIDFRIFIGGLRIDTALVYQESPGVSNS